MAQFTRRTLLSRALLVAGAAGGAALGLTRTVHHRRAVPPPAPPAALLTVLRAQQDLLAGYRRGSAAEVPALPALSADVQSHGAAVLALLELYPGWRLAPNAPAPGPAGAGPAMRSELAAAGRAAARTFTDACARWPATEPHAVEIVPVLGSIAAALSTHVQVLS